MVVAMEGVRVIFFVFLIDILEVDWYYQSA